jgi:hypothetical protein
MGLGKHPEILVMLHAAESRLPRYLLRSRIFCRGVAAIASCGLCAPKGVLFKIDKMLGPRHLDCTGDDL